MRKSSSEAFQTIPQPVPLLHAARRGQLNLRAAISAGRFPDQCFVVPEDAVPLRTAKIHASLRYEPLCAIQRVQEFMCSLVLFECRVCRVRFPAFPPGAEPGARLQVVSACSNVVGTWDETPRSSGVLARVAARRAWLT